MKSILLKCPQGHLFCNHLLPKIKVYYGKFIAISTEPEIPVNDGISSPDEEANVGDTQPDASLAIKDGNEQEKDGEKEENLDANVEAIEDVTKEKEPAQKTVS